MKKKDKVKPYGSPNSYVPFNPSGLKLGEISKIDELRVFMDGFMSGWGSGWKAKKGDGKLWFRTKDGDIEIERKMYGNEIKLVSIDEDDDGIGLTD